mgnify:CR=1 FL=1
MTVVAAASFILVVHPGLAATGVRELIDLARAKPGQLTYASTGTGGTNHLVAELFSSMTGVRMVHVPYKGGGPLLTDLLGGQIMVALSGLLTAPQFEKSGKLRVLGHTGGHRLASWPDMPTIAEGIPGFELVG